MESFSAKRSSAAVNLDGETGETKQRLGARQRAFSEMSLLLDYAEENGLSVAEMRDLLPGLQEGTWNPAGTADGETTVNMKSRSYVLELKTGRKIQQNYSGDSNDLKELNAEHCWVFKNKKIAKLAVENDTMTDGVQLF